MWSGWPDAPQVRGDVRDDLGGIRAIELLIPIVQQRDVAYAQDLRSCVQFRLANLRQRRGAGMLSLAGTMTAVSAAVAPRRGQQNGLDAFGCVFRERAD